jgi:hypothetical protein
MDNPHTPNSNNTQNKTTPTQPIPKTITENEKTQTNNQIPLQAGVGNSNKIVTAGIQPTHNYSRPSQFSQFNSPGNTKHASQTKTSTNYIICNGTSFHPD